VSVVVWEADTEVGETIIVPVPSESSEAVRIAAASDRAATAPAVAAPAAAALPACGAAQASASAMAQIPNKAPGHDRRGTPSGTHADTLARELARSPFREIAYLPGGHDRAADTPSTQRQRAAHPGRRRGRTRRPATAAIIKDWILSDHYSPG